MKLRTNTPSLTWFMYPVCLVLILFSLNGFSQSFDWKTALPESEGFSKQKIEALRVTLARHKTRSILVIRNDKVILEWYASGWNSNKPHGTASLAKSLVGGVSLMMALNDKRLQVDDPASKFIQQWKTDPIKSRITIRQLASHSSGIEDAELSDREIAEAKAQDRKISGSHMDMLGWKGDFWRKNPDPFTIARDEAPVVFTPGTEEAYSNPGMAMLSYAITASYQGTKYNDIRELLWERIYRPIGIDEHNWQIGYDKTYKVDGLGLVPNWGGASFTPRDVARIGRLMLNKGNWNGQQLVASKSVDEVISYGGTPLPHERDKQLSPAYGLGWYNNFDGFWQAAPRDLFLGAGAGNQILLVIPSLNIIVVRNGEAMNDPSKMQSFYYGVVNNLINPLMDAYTEPPYPMSEIISKVKFAPASTIGRKARDSDNWPITWADDGDLYTAYGDGFGFGTAADRKLSLGIAKVTGGPEYFKGNNIRSPSGEQEGNGRVGEKASGMLMVNGILYMWIRNANHDGEESRLSWSADHGKTWKFSDWKFASGFGCPTFLNFGKNYEGARDGYVYIYSADEKDAYKPSDQMVLARVPKNKMLDRTAYQFFSQIGPHEKPVWTKDLSERGPVFTHPAMCYRSGITYNSGLKRYLWCQSHPDSKHPEGSRFQGGFGIYESSNPWGPWRTVFYTRDWDVGPGETCSFPSKWMSADGKTCWLVFSGDDCFSIRKVTFITK